MVYLPRDKPSASGTAFAKKQFDKKHCQDFYANYCFISDN